jgi:hypothetical protein
MSVTSLVLLIDNACCSYKVEALCSLQEEELQVAKDNLESADIIKERS